jgi:hypothetical protein
MVPRNRKAKPHGKFHRGRQRARTPAIHNYEVVKTTRLSASRTDVYAAIAAKKGGAAGTIA